MMVKTGNTTHDNKVQAAEATRQAAVTPSSTPAAVRTAEVAFYQTTALSSIANLSVANGNFLQALKAQGASLYA